MRVIGEAHFDMFATRSIKCCPRAKAQTRRVRALPFYGLVAALFLSGCDWAVLNPKGPVGDGNATLLVNSVAIMLVIVVPTIIATLGVAWWFRSSNQRAFYLPDWEYLRPARIDRVGDSAAHHHTARRSDLDRLVCS